jgi:hypothetical protein
LQLRHVFKSCRANAEAIVVFSRHRERAFSNFAFIMKPNRARSRKPAVIANSRWLAYATAGAASAFTCANSAEATIHYSGRINRWFDRHDSVSFQLDQPGDVFRLRHYLVFSSPDYGGSGHFGIVAPAGAAFAGVYGTCAGSPTVASVSELRGGQLISHRPFLQRESGLLAGTGYYTNCGGFRGQFDENEVGFIGFKFNNGSGEQYGWVRIQMGATGDHNFKLIDYAYGDVGDRVRAGQRSSNEMVPKEGSLGWLSLGAAGLLAWRKTRSRKLSHSSS